MSISGTKTLDDLPEELILSVFKYIPGVLFLGPNSIRNVCTKWHRIGNDEHLFSSEFIREIVEQGLQDPDITLNALTDDAISTRLSLKYILTLTAHHEALCARILND